MVDQNADLKMENLTARGLICHKVTAEAVTVMVALDHIFQCGMGWPFGCTDLHGVSSGSIVCEQFCVKR